MLYADAQNVYIEVIFIEESTIAKSTKAMNQDPEMLQTDCIKRKILVCVVHESASASCEYTMW